MGRLTSAITVAISTAGLMLYAAQAASAAVPANDTSATATVVSSLPFSDTLDTTQATTDAEDASLNSNCGAPATEASVWYAYTSATDDTLIVDVSQSSYSAGVIVATGSPGSLSLVDCGPGTVIDGINAGQTLYFMAFDDTVGNGVGGTLQISIASAPPPPSLSATIDPVGHFNARTGVATISGTVTCSGGDFVDLEVDLRQKVGRVYITGAGFTELSCDGTSAWSVDVQGQNGTFAGGKVAAVALSFSCNVVSCNDSSTQQTVLLKK
jgi:hypothetical protein